MSNSRGYDYIIVGAGSAGCVLANRLSADETARVLLIEAGPGDRDWHLQMPASLAWALQNKTYNWAYQTEPEPFLDGRRMDHPRGKVIGGSSSINGMMYVRGHRRDFDRWAQSGCRGWSYDDVLPYFRKAETYSGGGDEYRGDSGPLNVTEGVITNPLSKAWIEAAVQAGYPYNPDINGAEQEGVGPIGRTTHRGRRWSTASAYLHPVRHRPNLAVMTRALTTAIRFEGDRAVAVEVSVEGRSQRISASREIILSGGAFNSPQLLLLSGVGPVEHLREIGIPVVADRPGVGQNLHDHVDVIVKQRCTQPVTLYRKLSLAGKAKIGLRWFLFRDGDGATNHYETGGFVRSGSHVEHPDLELMFLAMATSVDANQSFDSMPFDGFQTHCDLLRPTSRGWLKLADANPRTPPRILFNYLQTPEDRAAMRTAVRLIRDIHERPALGPYRGGELFPGENVSSDAEIDAYLRKTVDTGYHPVSTCKMGPDSDPTAVVDPACRVHGLRGLRVVDASIMPSIVSGNTNASTIMIAEKAADMIRGAPANPAS
ncbi:choline dehydrogenase [Hypericibacter adhaerens]|uniref:Choline dehydrogenase n=1 Tax=Hypericibacter adhaerens TaxID=2602016 RepID=A0A5J6MU28_9PROT|nr:choline dehydrogenase [Hypericibacter adhaerens]QEX20859.1 choline dehydrogenase [Hypericibacter adhaerens]